MKRKLTALLLLLCLMLSLLPAASADGEETVRVGFFSLGSCMIIDENGEAAGGYVYDLICELSTYNKWSPEFVCGDFPDLYDMLLKGEIDILPCIMKTEEREQEILYARDPIASEIYYIAAPAGSGISLESESMNGLRVATVIGSKQNDLLKEWAEENSVNITIMLTDSYESMWDMALNGLADLVLNLNLSAPKTGFTNLIRIGSNDSCIGIAPSRADLKETIDSAMDTLAVTSPFLMSHLQEKYLGAEFSALDLSEEEHQWLADHPVIRVGGFNNDFPFEIENNDGSVSGTYPDTLNLVLERLDLQQHVQVEWTLYSSIQELRSALLAGELDLISDEYHSYHLARENGVIISEPINEVTMGLLTLAEGETANEKIAVASTRLGGYFAEEAYPDSELLYLNTVPECVDAVATGKAGYAVAHTSLLQQFSRSYKQKFSIGPINYTCDVCYGARPEDSALISILNRGLHLIRDDDRSAMELKYGYNGTGADSYTMADFLRDNRWLFIIGLIAVLLLVLYAVNRARTSAKLQKNLDEINRLHMEQEEKDRLLEQALEQAQAANLAKTAFLNNMSHDIRTPMNAIIGYTGMASAHIDNREQVESCLAKIKQSSGHLLSLINDVLDMSRIESGKVTLQEKEESLSDIIHTLQDITQSDIRGKNLSFSLDTTDVRDETVFCDKLRLNQILLNILSNSIKYTPAGGAISFSLKETPCASGDLAHYEFRIKDNGIGMSEEFLKTVFDPFTRVNSSTVSGIQGTGLGMAITGNLVNLMGGTIDITSEEGKGTETVLGFDFRLAERAIAPAAPRVEYDFSGKKLLLVEDNEMNREIALEILEDNGFTVDTAEDGSIAVEKVISAPEGTYDLILMDVQMPVMDGYEATRHIRASVCPLADIPILAMTANAFEEDRQLAIAAGMTEHLTKPIEIDKLREALSRFLG